MKEGIIMKKQTIFSYRLKSGVIRYGFRIYTGIHPKTGKPSQTTRRGFLTYKEAFKEKERIQSLVHHHQYFSTTSLTFLDIYHEWFQLKSLSVKPATLLTYQAHLTSFKPLFFLQIDEISSSHLFPIFESLMKNSHSQASLNAKWSFLSMIFNYAFHRHYIKENPLLMIPRPKIHSTTPQTKKYLTETELTHFLQAVKHENFKYYCLCYLAAITGMRIGELMALTWKDIDFVHQTISITQNNVLDLNHHPILSTPKSKSSIRTIEVDASTLQLLEQWHHQNSSMFLFPNRDGKLANTDIPKTWIHRFCQNHPQLPLISFHTFRHTHASMLFSHNVPPKIIQHRLGYSSIKITMDIYIHLSENQQHDSIHQFFQELHLE